MEIIILSKSLKELDVKKATTSSQIFELEFAKSLSSYAKVSIVSLQAVRNEIGQDISLYCINNLKSFRYEVNDIIDSNKLLKGNINIVIGYGYDFFIFNNLKWICNKFNAKLISFTFDTHKAAIENRKGIRRLLIDLYFKIGIKKLNNIDGILLFKEKAYQELKLKIPYLITRVGINHNAISSGVYERKSNKCFEIVYAGSLTKYNGIEEMISAMKYINLKNISLNIYGDGPLKKYVIQSSILDGRIHYGGLLTKEEIDNVIKSADLLLNLRDTNHVVERFAFPSKLIQYLSSGIPVLSTEVIRDKEFGNVVFLIDELNPLKISDMICYINSNYEEQQKRVILSKEYVRKNYLWDDIIKDVFYFFTKI